MITYIKKNKKNGNNIYPILDVSFLNDVFLSENKNIKVNKIFEPHSLIEKNLFFEKGKEKIISPLLYLTILSQKQNIGKNKFNEYFKLYLDMALDQVSISMDVDIINFRNIQQQKILDILIKNLDINNTINLIEWSKKFCKPHDIIKSEQIVEIIFKQRNVKALKIFNNLISSTIWDNKLNLSEELWEKQPHLFLPDSISFWPIEYSTLNVDWLNELLSLGCYTDGILKGVYNENDIETIALRVLKVCISTTLTTEIQKTQINSLEPELLKINELWLRRDQHPINALSLLLKYKSSIEGTWNGTPWWNTWIIVRKTPPYDMELPWSEWPIDVLSIIDALAEQKYFEREKEKWFSGKEKNIKKRL